MADRDPTPEELAIAVQKKRMEDVEAGYIEERSTFRKMVAEHLANGGSPTQLGRAFDPPVGRGRIYQYVEAWRKEQAS